MSHFQNVCVCWLTCVRNICGPHDAPDLLHGLQVRRETCGEDVETSHSANLHRNLPSSVCWGIKPSFKLVLTILITRQFSKPKLKNASEVRELYLGANYECCSHRNTCGTNTSVTAEDLLIHYGGDGQAVEAVGECLPQFDVESAFTCKYQQGQQLSWRFMEPIWSSGMRSSFTLTTGFKENNVAIVIIMKYAISRRWLPEFEAFFYLARLFLKWHSMLENKSYRTNQPRPLTII